MASQKITRLTRRPSGNPFEEEVKNKNSKKDGPGHLKRKSAERSDDDKTASSDSYDGSDHEKTSDPGIPPTADNEDENKDKNATARDKEIEDTGSPSLQSPPKKKGRKSAWLG